MQCCVVPSSKAAFRQSNKSTAINAALFLFQDAPKTTVDKLKIAREWLDEHPLVGRELNLLLYFCRYPVVGIPTSTAVSQGPRSYP